LGNRRDGVDGRLGLTGRFIVDFLAVLLQSMRMLFGFVRIFRSRFMHEWNLRLRLLLFD